MTILASKMYDLWEPRRLEKISKTAIDYDKSQQTEKEWEKNDKILFKNHKNQFLPKSYFR